MNGAAAVLLAGGSGQRFGGPLPKQLLVLDGEPLIARSLRVLDDHPALGVVALVAHPDWEAELRAIAAEVVRSTTLLVVTGGRSRNESTLAAVRRLPASVEHVLVHDGARPLVTEALVTASLGAIVGADAVLPVVETIDLIARVEGDRVVGFEDRSSLRRGQTPQVFGRALLQRALEAVPADDPDRYPTLYEALLAVEPDALIRAIPGDVNNLKLTVPLDQLLVRTILGVGDDAYTTSPTPRTS